MTRSFGDGALVVLALIAGALLPLQALINGRLSGALGNPFWASIGQNVVGTTAMALVVLSIRAAPPPAGQFIAAPAWAWLGGALGAAYVLAALVATPRLGATRAVAAIIAGQLIASVLLDQFGVLHPARPATLRVIGGVALLSLGAALVLTRD
jgi:transporter family-2 protein